MKQKNDRTVRPNYFRVLSFLTRFGRAASVLSAKILFWTLWNLSEIVFEMKSNKCEPWSVELVLELDHVLDRGAKP